MLKVHKKGIYNIIIKIMCASACVRTRSCAKNRRRGKLRNKAIRPMTYSHNARVRMTPEQERGENVCAHLPYRRVKYREERVKSGVWGRKSCPKAKNSRIIEYHGLITDEKARTRIKACGSVTLCGVSIKSGVPDTASA